MAALTRSTQGGNPVVLLQPGSDCRNQTSRVIRATIGRANGEPCARSQGRSKACSSITCSVASSSMGNFNPAPSSSSPGVGGGTAPYLPFLRPSPSSDSSTQQLSTEELLNILTERQGMWYEHAPHITTLQQRGVSPAVIAEVTGLQGSEQSTMVVAAQVHNTLKEANCSALPYYNVGGAEVLYELRVLPVNRRQDAAAYIAEQNWDAKGAKELAKAMKEHERRGSLEGRDSFSTLPADCMAYSLYKKSQEDRSLAHKTATLQKALEYATTEKAVAKVKEAIEMLLTPEKKPLPGVAVWRVPTIRLKLDEVYPRPIPVLGKLQDLTLDAFKEASASTGVVRMEGPFEIFRPEAGSMWMAVPSWPAVTSARGPVAGVIVEDVEAIPSLKGKKIPGPLLLVLELGTGEGSGSNLFLSHENGLLTFTNAASDTERLARALVAVLPPKDEDDSQDLDD